ncbi:methionine-synthesizing 5- methyltetrahydropteroyltriglutamate--homocysteine methyltransferase [Dimargaris cristalligena]|uniref:5-methyltetrahydropteroyltriglutamate--homocysteine S-methyltransferase n=1 Tax=Dimargaris cristalligena TaxID=215637 RepID=A0A4P9ZM90_9FUNG|nr:methionine-synthesizing 5- methyltetrahydropteroyltriglutamate--homocysteine methyltransferase [Dimargaris cristalligena]RKP34248.1 cobalamin-independent methionine synthase [Dimargaris cristalligena]|eukprot:RKP34248.1 cobalamin-independent methionine synthase [Dimargaris cristalligena]
MSAAATLKSSVLGYPRVGNQRQLKKLIEGFWAGKVDESALVDGARALRTQHWQLQRSQGIDLIPSGDFTLYDLVLDTSYNFGAIPTRYQTIPAGLPQYFAMARGLQGAAAKGADQIVDVPAMEMKKWFDTNYHYIVPELGPEQTFQLTAEPSLVAHFKEAKALGIHTKPVLIGPVSFLLLAKASGESDFQPLELLPRLLPEYRKLLAQLAEAGATWIQVDEPHLGLDSTPATEAAYKSAYQYLADGLSPSLRLLLTTYFERVDDRMALISKLPVHGLHLDLVRHPQQLPGVLDQLPADWVLSLGVVNGRNIWKTEFATAIDLINQATNRKPLNQLVLATSCSLLHSPYSLEFETKLDSEIKDWLAFANEKLGELATLTAVFNIQQSAEPQPKRQSEVDAALEANKRSFAARRTSARVVNPQVQDRLAKVQPDMVVRPTPFAERYPKQKAHQKLPLFPTTTIGSFPQTKEVRQARLKFKKGELSAEDYRQFLLKETERCVRIQEDIGIDVLVHGEFERNDMVEYFGEKLRGYVFTQNGWVASYGTRCVKPPVIYGDIDRPNPMTVDWSVYAQSLTTKPMKGMLTGPVTCLQWSFVRDDQPRRVTAQQLALAIRDEVDDLEKAGISTIQIDEPAIREGLPLRRTEWEAYLKWAVDAFLLSSCSVQDTTQIHTHMCYSDFNDIFPAIQRMDADVITIENSRSDLKLLRAFDRYGYHNASGPGLYDIHSPRVPTVEEMNERLAALLNYLPFQLIWLNPDCGLKTRDWAEVEASLRNLTATAGEFRRRYADQA